MNFGKIPRLGIGIGLRPAYLDDIFATWPKIDWFEIISENFLHPGPNLRNLEILLERYPLVMHGVNLSIGSADSLDWDYLRKLKALARKTKSPWVSDHLAWGRLPGAYYHDLLPLPKTRAVVEYVAARARIVQDFLEVPFALENLSSYASFVDDELTEWEFYREVAERADIPMMLDINNVYVSAVNGGFDPHVYLDHLPLERVIQIHLAGHRDHGAYLFDSHDAPVADPVWELYAAVYPKTGGASTLLEWDDRYIPFEETWKEALRAKQLQEQHA